VYIGHVIFLKFRDRCCFGIHVMAEEAIAVHQCEKIFAVKYDDINGGLAPDRGSP